MTRSQEVERIAKKLDKMVQKKKTVSKSRLEPLWNRGVCKNTFSHYKKLISVRFIRMDVIWGFNALKTAANH